MSGFDLYLRPDLFWSGTGDYYHLHLARGSDPARHLPHRMVNQWPDTKRSRPEHQALLGHKHHGTTPGQEWYLRCDELTTPLVCVGWGGGGFCDLLTAILLSGLAS